MTHTKMAEQRWEQLREEHEIAYLRGGLATSSPESYTLEEMKGVSDGMFESTARIDAAMRADFWNLPADARVKLLDMLGASDCQTRVWWEEVLGVSGKPTV